MNVARFILEKERRQHYKTELVKEKAKGLQLWVRDKIEEMKTCLSRMASELSSRYSWKGLNEP